MSSEGLRTLADALALAKGWRSMEALACSRTGRAPQAAAESGAPRPEMLPSGADGESLMLCSRGFAFVLARV